MKMKKLAAAAATLALVTAACGDNKSSTSTTKAAGGTTTAAPGTTTASATTGGSATTAATATTSGGAPSTVVPKFDVPDVPMQQTLGKGEGALSIIAWAGYAEDGSNDPKLNWVGPFEQQTGCKVTVKIGNTSDEMVSLMQAGGYDGVSASGDATWRLISAGLVAPVNTSLVPSYADIFPFLKDRAWNSVNGKMYGIPHGWGANILQYRTDVVKPAPDSWGAVFDPNSPYKGKITAYDSPIYIADAALYLMKTKPELKITNPYALDQTQFDAAIALLKQQKSLVGEYWSDYLKYEQSATSGSIVLGTSWQVIVNTLQGATPPVPVDAVLPKEGSTGWSDTWMIAAKAAHPNCMYMWMNYITSPDVNAQVAGSWGEAPANAKACALIDSTGEFCKTYHAADAAYADQIWYWTTPTKTCLDGRGDVCVPYSEWAKGWDSVKG